MSSPLHGRQQPGDAAPATAMSEAGMVARGLVPSPFHPRTGPLNLHGDWMRWAGYLSARRFDSVEAEYFAIRNQATLFDISPMHKYRISGPDAERVMNRLVTRDVRKIAPGRVGYTFWCDEDGFVIDDGTLFRFSAEDFRLCCQEPQYAWLHDVAWGFDVEIADESEAVAGLSLQGPTSFAVLEAAGLGALSRLRPFDLAEAAPGLTVSRSGFTGDLGYELWTPAERALDLWDRLWAAGRDLGLRAIGNAALDLARIEAGFVVSGIDFKSIHAAVRPSRGRTPFELGAERLVDLDKGHFNGRRALLRHLEAGPRYRLVGLEIDGNKAPHNAYVYHRKKTEAGHITSTLWSPTCKRNLALAMLKAPYGVKVNSDLWVEIYLDKEGKWERIMAQASIVERPFFRHPRRSATPPARF
ncbi:MAG: aminomethyltransferase family protein [Kiloniellaceae bacterium]